MGDRRYARSILPFLALLAGIGECAEGQVRLAGRVTNENGAPLGGAELVFRKSPQGPPMPVFADPSGRYEATLPAPGAYRVDVERTGHFPLRGQLITLQEGDNEIDFTLNRLREVFESVEVAAAAPPVDMNTTETRETVSASQIVNVPYPTTNDLRNALRIIPGVVQDARGGLHINGGQENQTLYTLDGFNITDPLTGRFESRLSVEAVQTVDVVGGRISPEYGKGSAGVLAINTKTGDDKFRTAATNFIPGIEYRKGLMVGGWTPRFNFSGPIRKGRAWFSDSFDIQYVTAVVKELPRGQDRTASWRGSNHLNTQVNLTPSNILYTGFLLNAYTAPRWGLSALDPVETTRDLRRRQWFFHVKDQIYLTSDVLIEAGYAANRTFSREIPQGHDLYRITPDGARGNFFLDSTMKSSRDQAIANAFLPPFQLWGEHRLKTGADLNRLLHWQDIRRTGYEQLRGNYVPMRRTVFGGSGRTSLTNYEASFYIQDSWRVRPNLLVEAGFRGDWDQILHYWNVSPRTGFAWSPPGLERTKISGGYGMIYDATPLRVFLRPLDQYALTTYFAPDGRIVRDSAVTVFTIQHPRLPRPRYRNFSLGWDQEWTEGVQTRVEYLRRRGRYGFTYVNQLSPSVKPPAEWVERFNNLPFDAIYDLTNDRRDLHDSYRVTLRHVIRRQYEWLFSYTRSRSLSNAVADFSVDDPIIVDFNVGPMPWDSPNRILSWGYLPTFLKKWAVAYLLEWRTGFPFSVISEDGRVVGGVNAFRFPDHFELNVHLERRFEFRKNLWAFRMGCNNITNHNNPNVVNNNMGSHNFLTFYGGPDRSYNFRIRWLGKAQ
jgi:hypothetical protein